VFRNTLLRWQQRRVTAMVSRPSGALAFWPDRAQHHFQVSAAARALLDLDPEHALRRRAQLMRKRPAKAPGVSDESLLMIVLT
jgi:hypothetical protein